MMSVSDILDEIILSFLSKTCTSMTSSIRMFHNMSGDITWQNLIKLVKQSDEWKSLLWHYFCFFVTDMYFNEFNYFLCYIISLVLHDRTL
jgi:hypothetical protein